MKKKINVRSVDAGNKRVQEKTPKLVIIEDGLELPNHKHKQGKFR